MARALMALGSNLGDRPTLLRSALLALDRAPRSRLLKRSRSYATQPVGGPAGQDGFLNAAALIETQLPPQRLLDELHAIEHSLGRASAERWTARTIDLDLLLYDGPRGRDSFSTGDAARLSDTPVANEYPPPGPAYSSRSRS
ncbi:MAG: 2-amino-4-hydroxy-6-hydroxymethyldihydropteridine diphosphokinase, partial [Pirellulales bacterium]|nr:2-amino-4-hydroxy-6-hydroxymethyldihydropteridine diphosphokinase [Pirellulales bacterium]